jgi:type II secretory pathway pseudopilin PulG
MLIGSETRRAFTLAELLAAMVFVAIVLPVAVRGVMVANRAGVLADRQRVAAQLADRLLTEMVVTEDWRDSEAEGDFGEEWPGYRWTLKDDAWDEDTMRILTIEVSFEVQDRPCRISLSTLVDEEEQE